MEDKGELGNSHRYTSLDATYSDHNMHCKEPQERTYTRYLDVLDDEGNFGNRPEVPSSNVDKNTQEPPADKKYLSLIHI